MHDRKKVPKEVLDAAQKEQLRNKIAAYQELCTKIISLRKSLLGVSLRPSSTPTTTADESRAEPSSEASQAGATAQNSGHEAALRDMLSLLNKVLLISPDYLTMWNTRKEVVCGLLGVERDSTPSPARCEAESPDGKGSETRASVIKAELDFTLEVITTRDPKSYGTWYRKWVLTRFGTPELLQKELALCAKALKQDERNFHCWGYRRFITALAESSAVYNDAQELQFTQTRIESNFSNYSAWHNRALIFRKWDAALGSPSDGRSTVEKLVEEFELVSQAMYTDPGDQSAWIYCKYLLKCVDHRGLIRPRLVELCRELLPNPPEFALGSSEKADGAWLQACSADSKWPLVLLADALEEASQSKCSSTAQLIWARVGELDPSHRQYYSWRAGINPVAEPSP
eukprot:RCo055441